MRKGRKTREEVWGDLALDIGKMIFGGAVLVAIFEANINRLAIILAGVVICAILLFWGVHLTTNKK